MHQEQRHGEHSVRMSIGLPVWNAEKQIASVIDSILSQSFQEFELIISDNASFDGTGAICQKYAETDNRIKYFRQSSNIGALKNFQFVLRKSTGKYFMWAASDDLRSNDYILENITHLEIFPGCVFSASPNCFEGDFSKKIYDFNIKGVIIDRLSKFLSLAPKSHACFYAVIRRESLSNFLDVKNDYLGLDWSVVVDLLRQGEFHRINLGKLVLGVEGASTRADFFKKMRTKPIERIIPLYIFSFFFIKLIRHTNELSYIEKIRLLLSLINLNIIMQYASFRRKVNL